jgi:hypothetical protein
LRLRFCRRRWLLIPLGLGLGCFSQSSLLVFPLGPSLCFLSPSLLLVFPLGLSLGFLSQSLLLLVFPLGLSLGFLSPSLLLAFPLGLGLGSLSQSLPLPLRSPAFVKRWTKPGAVGTCAITSKNGTQSGNPGMPLLSLPGQIVLQDHSLVAPSPDFPAQSHHRFGQYTHVCPRFPKVRPMHWHFRFAPNA